MSDRCALCGCTSKQVYMRGLLDVPIPNQNCSMKLCVWCYRDISRKETELSRVSPKPYENDPNDWEDD